MLPFGRLWGYAQWVNAYLADEVIAETAPCGAVRHGAECALDGLVLDLFFCFRFLVPHNLILALDPWISQSIDGFGIGPQAATFTFHRRGFWHLKLEKNDQIHPNCIIPSRCSK